MNRWKGFGKTLTFHWFTNSQPDKWVYFWLFTCSEKKRFCKTKQVAYRSFVNAPTVILWWIHLKISVTQEFLLEILNQENIFILFFPCSIKSCRVSPKNLGFVAYKNHTYFLFWPKVLGSGTTISHDHVKIFHCMNCSWILSCQWYIWKMASIPLNIFKMILVHAVSHIISWL